MNKLAIFKNVFSFPLTADDNLIPKQDIVKQSLVVVIAIMCFLCTTGLASVYLLNKAVIDWNKSIEGESTIEVLPRDGHDIKDDLKKASNLAMQFSGIYDTEIVNEATIKNLLQPLLGKNLDFNELPIARLIIIHLTDSSNFDSLQFNEYLHQYLPNANFNNQHIWVQQLQTMASSSRIIVGFIVILLCLALIITIIFATLSAVSTNKHIIDILHFLSADKDYIVRQFDIAFFYKSLQGCAIGASGTILLFFWLYYFNAKYHNAHLQLSIFFSDFKLSILYYLEMLLMLSAVVLIIVITCRFTVLKKLYNLEAKR